MQQGSIIKAERKSGLDVWEFRWREPGPDGKRKHRRMVIGRIDQLVDESAARGRIAALHLDINFCDARLKGKPLTISELAEHYRQRELKPDTVWKFAVAGEKSPFQCAGIKRPISWNRTLALANRWLPQPDVLHPYPAERFAVSHPR